MKISKHIVSASLVILFSTTGCNDFLDKAPLDELTESTAFITYDNLKLILGNCMKPLAAFQQMVVTLPPTFPANIIRIT